jgi:uncharacterized protein YbjT (DUF2867 family)
VILVTGATGFVGRSVVRRLLADGHPVRCLVRPPLAPHALPLGILEIRTGDVHDRPALQAGLQGVDIVIHLAGAHRPENGRSVEEINRQGAANLVDAAVNAGARHMIFLSHMHADRNSAYPLLRGKGAAEEAIRRSGLRFTILRSSLIFGPDDSFTTVMAMLLKAIPIVFPVIGEAKTRFQPIHVDDVAHCVASCVDAYHLQDVTLPIGGPQHLSYAEILEAVTATMGVRRARLQMRLPLMRSLVRLSGALLPHAPVSNEQLDLFAIDNTTDLGNVPRNFDLEPRRFTENLDYLRAKGWRVRFLRHVLHR